VKYNVEYSDLSKDDLKDFPKTTQRIIRKLIDKVSQNPLPQNEGGYGKPLGNKKGYNLTGLCKIKLLKLGIRVVYKIIRTDEIMKIIVIAARADDEVYEIAANRAGRE